MSTTLHSFVDIFDADFGEEEDLVQLKKIEIPIIQRDYAQGRKNNDVDRVRRRFLESLYKAVTEKPITLDFVYGDIDKDGVMTPLDGQQRLTTLYLLHWYAAKKCNINADKTSFLKSFSYKTRPSARDFCLSLVEFMPSFSKKISKEIIDQAWFPLDWKKDPTIKSMLVMLDAIDDVFKDVENLWECLENKAITFYFLPIKDMGLTDELYIKMNSRGKPLTVFEHFKAELERQIREIDESVAKRIMPKFDQEWMDLLWLYRDAGTGTDADMITDDEFLNYFKFICDVICYRNGDSAQGRSYDEFDLIDMYFSHHKEDSLDHFIVLEKFFDCWCDMKTLGFSNPTEFLASIFSTEHEANKVMVDSINIFEDCVHNYADQNGRNRQFPLGRVILLYALCTYLQHRESVDSSQLLRRIRIVNNLIRNSNDEISDRSDRNRMQALLQATEDIIVSGVFKDEADNNFNVHQIAEEKEKISFVDSNPDMAEKLYSLEDHDLLRGQISIIGLDHLDLSDRFVSLFTCNQDRVDCALMAIGDISQQERRTYWRYQFASYGIKDAWLNLFHKSGNSLGFENTHEVLVNLLSRSEFFDDVILSGIADEYISKCENEHIYPWRYYYIKYSEFRPGRYGKAFFDDKENKPYEMLILLTQFNSSESSYIPYLYIADHDHINRDQKGRQLLYPNCYVTMTNGSYEIFDKTSDELIETLVINQNEDGTDIEDRVMKLKVYLDSRK